MAAAGRRLLAGTLSLALAGTILPTAAYAGSPVVRVNSNGRYMDNINTYQSGMFSDVSSADWFESGVRVSYETGLLNGTGNGKFSPKNSITFLQTIVLAARLHNTFWQNQADFSNGDPWYQPYVEYAVQVGILESEDWLEVSLSDWNRVINRKGFIFFVSSAVPRACLEQINTLPEGGIPDLAKDDAAYESCKLFYQSGLLTGVDQYGNLKPDNGIIRADVATILSRIVDPSTRQKTSWRVQNTAFNPVAINKLPHLKSLKERCTDAEFQQAYDVAAYICEEAGGKSRAEQLQYIYAQLRAPVDAGAFTYSTTAPHYSDPYGYFCLGVASCAGATRAVGLCLDILGIPFEHVNENQWSHQWCRVPMGDGTYWICDSYGMYVGPEPAPYQHPMSAFFN